MLRATTRGGIGIMYTHLRNATCRGGCFLAATVLLAWPAPTDAGCGDSYTFILIADSDGPLNLAVDPCCDEFDAGNIWPAIEIEGVVVFRSDLDAGGDGIFTGDGFIVHTLVETRDADPTSDFLFLVGPPTINGGDRVAFAAFRDTGTIMEEGIYTTKSAHPIDTVAVTDMTDPTSPFRFLSTEPNIRTNNDVVFTAALVEGSTAAMVVNNGFSNNILFTVDDSQVLSIEHAAATDTDIAFIGNPDSDPFLTGLYRHKLSSVTPVHVEADQIPRPPSVGGYGAVSAIVQYSDGGDPGRRVMNWNYIGGDVLADSLTDGIFIYAIASVSGNTGCTVYVAYDQNTFVRGIYAADDDGFEPVIEVGDILLGGVVLDLQLYKHAMNDRGQFAFWAQLSDDRRVIVRADPERTPDIDGSGTVDINDLLLLLAAWGDCLPPPAPCDADLDFSGTVDISDVLVLLAGWG
jgi:hypothetical protein